ncbi:hypothetical protein CYY_003056 [Polysphondylium violaceum]|uniref:Coiled-coil domain-containing protein 86 n=1 Tax=Polysphondylium violaceum TaxID=133409 RepID=A0A8J4PVC2_9MYCE|nr:hypothetical protein CYY_003056 [Polysphondylium violaceum]
MTQTRRTSTVNNLDLEKAQQTIVKKRRVGSTPVKAAAPPPSESESSESEVEETPKPKITRRKVAAVAKPAAVAPAAVAPAAVAKPAKAAAKRRVATKTVVAVEKENTQEEPVVIADEATPAIIETTPAVAQVETTTPTTVTIIDTPTIKTEAQEEATTQTANASASFRRAIPLSQGKPVSGRVWKQPSQKFHKMINVKSLKTTFEVKEQARMERKRIKDKENEIKQASRQAKTNMYNEMKENKKIKEANTKKSEVVQVIKNTAKIKKMNKKQLKLIRKA